MSPLEFYMQRIKPLTAVTMAYLRPLRRAPAAPFASAPLVSPPLVAPPVFRRAVFGLWWSGIHSSALRVRVRPYASE
jgi:hypothetical protein